MTDALSRRPAPFATKLGLGLIGFAILWWFAYYAQWEGAFGLLRLKFACLDGATPNVCFSNSRSGAVSRPIRRSFGGPAWPLSSSVSCRAAGAERKGAGMNKRSWLSRTVPRGMAAFALVSIFAGAASAAEWIERRYDPPVGSRWIIQRDLFSEERRNEDGRESVASSTMKITSELTIEAKTATGYRIAYRRIKSSYDGNADNAEAARASLSALENVVFRATTDASGKPLRVENIDEVRQAMRAMIDRLTSSSSVDPRIVTTVRGLLNGLTQLTPEQAAQGNLDEVPALAVVQNTGLKPGETRRGSDRPPNAVGLAMVKLTVLSIASADAASGDVRYALTENYDAASIREFLLAMAGKLGRDPEDMKKMEITLDGRTDFEVSGGMTRALHRQSTMKSNLMGNTLVITDRKDVRVTPAK